METATSTIQPTTTTLKLRTCVKVCQTLIKSFMQSLEKKHVGIGTLLLSMQVFYKLENIFLGDFGGKQLKFVLQKIIILLFD